MLIDDSESADDSARSIATLSERFSVATRGAAIPIKGIVIDMALRRAISASKSSIEASALPGATTAEKLGGVCTAGWN